MIKSTNTPGTITVTATAIKNNKELTSNLTASAITIQSIQADTTSLPFLTPVTYHGSVLTARRLAAVSQSRNSITVTFPGKFTRNDVKLVNFKGAAVQCPLSMTATSLILSTKELAAGYYLLSAGNSVAGNITKKISIIR